MDGWMDGSVAQKFAFFFMVSQFPSSLIPKVFSICSQSEEEDISHASHSFDELSIKNSMYVSKSKMESLIFRHFCNKAWLFGMVKYLLRNC